ncbi:hypothetical protein [Swingsia samuiensis]|uniref:Uncharacterized protein n=1 Tax=Swingsia samuiensis TaxID=1293412 RepID=A0A4Y6UIS4_9PROT|nr:hypothetical protein [Swingsia samuiensis]QDH17503.1 hypothetical protein E3D00_07960 [Swingsia samuiensis]
MVKSERLSSRTPKIIGGALLLAILAGGGVFLKLGWNPTPPEQVQVHKELSSALFSSQNSAAPAPLPVMPPVPAAPSLAAPLKTSTAATSTAAAVPGPSTPLPTMPAPKTAPAQGPVAGH